MAKGKTPSKRNQQIRQDVKDLSKQLDLLYGLSDPRKPENRKKLDAQIKVIKKLLDKDTFLCANPQMRELLPEDLGPAGKKPGETDFS